MGDASHFGRGLIVVTAAGVPGVGDIVYLSQAVARMSFYGVVTPADSPDQFAASMELQGDAGVVTMPVLVGERGPAGQPCFALRFQADLDVTDQADLPTTLTNTDADRGKYYALDDIDADGNLIGSSVYIWFGEAWRRMQMGTQGPPGPVPVITPSVEVFDKRLFPGRTSTVVTGGSAYQPTWRLELEGIEGPQGEATSLIDAPDVDFRTRPPEPGDVLGYTGLTNENGDPVWVPVSISALIPSPYSLPESAFQSINTIAPQAQVGVFALPPQPFPWTPIVWGHIQASGFDFDIKPLQLGCEVILGKDRQQRVGRGFGSAFGAINIMPHYSRPGNFESHAISPGNGRAVVPANHTNPSQGTLYISLYNDGATGVYNFSSENAQLFVLVVPIDAVDSFGRSG